MSTHAYKSSIMNMSHNMRFPTMWYVRPAKAQTSLPICTFEYSMTIQLLTEQHLEFLSLKGGCTVSSEFTLLKMSHCWKSHVTAHIDSYCGRSFIRSQLICIYAVFKRWFKISKHLCMQCSFNRLQTVMYVSSNQTCFYFDSRNIKRKLIN